MGVALKFSVAQSLAVAAAVVFCLCSNTFAGVAVENGDRWKSRTIRYAICDCSKGDPKPLCTSAQCVLKPGVIADAIAQWNKAASSVLKLVPRDPTDQMNPYILYVSQRGETGKSSEWCYTSAGFSGANGPHQVVIGNDCTQQKTDNQLVGAVLHETGHVVGLQHEQRRMDRDTYVDVKFPGSTADDAVSQSGRICTPDTEEKCEFRSAFLTRIYTYGQDLGSYDLKSVMHYPFFGQVDHCPLDQFKHKDKAVCMEPTDDGSDLLHQLGLKTDNIGRINALSEFDIKSIDQLYQGLGF